MTALRRALLAGMLLVLCSVPPAAAQTPDATLPSQCLDQQVAPVSVTFTCADGGFIAHDLVWSGGVGTYRVAATVSDVDFQYSKTVSRKSVTTD